MVMMMMLMTMVDDDDNDEDYDGNDDDDGDGDDDGDDDDDDDDDVLVSKWSKYAIWTSGPCWQAEKVIYMRQTSKRNPYQSHGT